MMQALRGPSGVLLGALVAGIAGLVTWLALAPGERAANEVVQVGPAGQSGGSDAIDAENPAPPAQPVPEVLPEVTLASLEGPPRALSSFRQPSLVVNFWATWCAPCRREMPSLERLQAAMPDIAVVPVATGRNAVEGIRRFFDDAGVRTLPILRDPQSRLAHGMGVMGLPVTVILNPEGQEVARLIGDAEWDSDSAKAVLGALAAGQ